MVTEINNGDEKRVIRDQICNLLLEKYHFVTMRQSQELYVYRDGVYRKDCSESLIREYTKQIMNEKCTKYDQNEILNCIKSSTYYPKEIQSDGDFWNVQLSLICVFNGILNWETGELMEHDPKYHFRNKLSIAYIPNQSCPEIDKFLTDICETENDVKALEEFAGYCLYRGTPFHKAFILIGDGDNGKSTFLKLLRSFLGVVNTTQISLQQICENRFSIANLRGKLANIYNDLPDKALWNTGMFKMVVAGDPIDAEIKLVQKRATFEPSCKQIFSCNKAPINERDDTRAFWRRWQPLFFNKTFTKEKGNKDEYILDKLTDKGELSGFLNKAIEGLKQLLEKKKFSNEETVETVRKQYIMKSNSIQYFVSECVETKRDNQIVKTELYDAYVKFCENHQLSPEDFNVFTRKLRKYVSFTDGRESSGLRQTCYCGIELVVDKNEKEQQTLPELTPSACPICNRLLPENLADTTVWQGMTVHMDCYRKMKEGIKVESET